MKAPSRFCISIFLSCAVAHPPSVAAHSSDALLLRVVFNDAAQITIEATADLNGIPWLKTASNPAELLGRTLKINHPNGRSWFVSEMSKPQVSLHAEYPHQAPIPVTHSAEEPPPELYTAAWTWRPSASPLQLEIARDNPVTSFLWVVSPQKKHEPATGWQTLVDGERSKSISLPFPPSPLQWNWKALTAAGIAACGLVLQGCLIVMRWRHIKKTSAPTA